MQIYYFTRTGRSKDIAEQLANRYDVVTRKIDDHKNWLGKWNYKKAAIMALFGKGVKVDYIKPDINDEIVVVFPLWAGNMPPGVKTFVNEVGKENITAIVTSLGSTLRKRNGFKKVIDLVGENICAPEIR